MIEITEILTHPLQTFEPAAPYTAEVFPSFGDFWDAYAYKKGKAQAERVWKKMNQDDREAAYAYLEGYIANTYTDGRYPSRRHPSVYLNKRTWEDELTVIERKPPPGIARAAGTQADLDEYYASKAAGYDAG